MATIEHAFAGLRRLPSSHHHSPKPHRRRGHGHLPTHIVAARSSPKLPGRPLRVAVIGGGPAGGAAAETLAKGGVETFLIERKLDNAKPCGGAIPLCMVGEFDLPLDIIDRKVTKMKMISPSNVSVDIGQTLKPHEYIGMVRREVLDSYLRERASSAGATLINGLFLHMDLPSSPTAPYTLHYNLYDPSSSSSSSKQSLTVDAVIGADGANSRVAKSIDAGSYEYAIAFQERIKIPHQKMAYYENLAEMYVGDDVSPDFYGWVFPKCDHVAVGTGTVTHKGEIKRFQAATRNRAREKIEGGRIIRVEAHPIPEHPRPRRVAGRVALVGDAAGYVTKCSGRGYTLRRRAGGCARRRWWRGARGEEDGGGGGLAEGLLGEVGQDVLAYLQGLGCAAEGVLQVQSRQGGVCGDVCRRLCAEDDF
ncbi:hypothetical protein Sjap_015665 [Stephania japonica]|uniref:Geranylgeranyl diphosphate reductase, chloroplastic n=1 Tax=Stephania japonica TaxID=461633 RepID=A0AAP0IKM8_9MAGN